MTKDICIRRFLFNFIYYTTVLIHILFCRLSETPPPQNTWQVSPVARHSHNYTGTSPLRRSSGNNSASSPLLTGPLAVLGSPTTKTLHDNNNTLRHSPVIPFGTRAVTLPEISGKYRYSFMYKEIVCCMTRGERQRFQKMGFKSLTTKINLKSVEYWINES